MDRLRKLPGVKTVAFQDGFQGTFRRPTQPVYVGAIDPTDVWLTVQPEVLTILPKDLEALRKTRTGALITPDLAKKYGWHIGDQIPIQSSTLQSNGSGTWIFDIVGTFRDHEIYQGGYIMINVSVLSGPSILSNRSD